MPVSLLLMLLLPGGEVSNPASLLCERRAQVISILGKPGAVVSPKSHAVYPPNAHERILTQTGMATDSYVKRYSGIEFGIQVFYLLDASESRLHPVERVRSVLYTPDQSLPFTKLLNALPVSQDLCKHGCSLDLIVQPGLFEASLHPTEVTAEQRRIAGKVSTFFDSYKLDNDDWEPTLQVFFKESPSEITQPDLSAFNKLDVFSITLGAEELDSSSSNESNRKSIRLPFVVAP